MWRFLQIRSFARTCLEIGIRKDVEGKFILQYGFMYLYNSVQSIVVLTTNKPLLFINYLRLGAISVPSTKLISTESGMLISDDITMARHSFSSPKISLMSGLCIEVGGTQDNAISRTFQAQLVLNTPCSLGSIMLWISPFSIRGLTHWSMWVWPLGPLIIGGWPVISSHRRIPKL